MSALNRSFLSAYHSLPPSSAPAGSIGPPCLICSRHHFQESTQGATVCSWILT